MLRLSPETITNWPLAARLADIDSLPTWRGLIVPAGQDRAIAEELAETLSSLSERPIRHHHVSNYKDLIHAAESPRDDILVLSGLAELDARGWTAVDVNRSRLEREAPAVLVVSERDVENLPTIAPHLWSFVGDGLWHYVPELGLTSAARAERLAAFRRQFGFDDAELLSRSERGELPSEPEIAEWLILIGEGNRVPGGAK